MSEDYERDTLCWYCKNVVPNRDRTVGCSWSIEFKPVKGWTARKCKKAGIKCGYSYHVYDCPEFVRDADVNI